MSNIPTTRDLTDLLLRTEHCAGISPRRMKRTVGVVREMVMVGGFRRGDVCLAVIDTRRSEGETYVNAVAGGDVNYRTLRDDVSARIAAASVYLGRETRSPR